MRLPLLDKENVKSINYHVLNEMVDTYMQRGFCYFDTAYMYHNGVSEVAIREAVVKRYPRESFSLADKMPLTIMKEKKDQEEIFPKQLSKCGVEYFDNYLAHNLGTLNYQKAQAFGTLPYINELKNKGLVKRIGFSFHDSAQLLDEILTEHPYFDFVQLQINYLDWQNDSIQSGKCYQVAQKHGKPVTVMEPLKGGILATPPEEALALFQKYNPKMSAASWGIRYAASLDNVKLVLSGMSDLEQIKDNTGYMQDFQPLNQEETKIVEQARNAIENSIAIPCTSCQYCVETCPQKIPIPKYFSLYNDKQRYDPKAILPHLYYNNYSKIYGKASDCIECRQCEEHCPQKLKIVELLKNVTQTFEV